MKRGEIYYANLDPTIGSEIKKKRPVLIVSNNANNSASPIITILPITSNINRIYSFEVALDANKTGLIKNSKIQCHQIRTISKLRISGNIIGQVDKEILQQINAALRLHLAMM